MTIKVLGIVALLFAASIAVYAVYRSSIYQECITDKSKQTGQQQQHQGDAALMVYVDCLGPFAHENHGPIVAVFTIILAFSTIALWFSTRDAAFAAKAAAEHIPKIERAYAKISHSPPGIEVEDATGLFWVTVAVKNFGNTPARVTDALLKPIVIRPRGEALPQIPDYSRRREKEQIPKAFLVAQEEFFMAEAYSITPEEMVSVKDLQSDLYLIGYVDYIDQFGERHRGGYARLYKPMIDDKGRYRTEAAFAGRNNLIFVTREGYNYDRPRQKGEGNDWDDTA
jgi:archaellum component FlaG (FlaF/FlaG flagellin family)